MKLSLVSYEETKKIQCRDLEDGEFPVRSDWIDEMIRVMRENDGMGIAAPQVGLAVNMFIMEPPKGNLYVVCNPRIVPLSNKYQLREEGCLTLPGERYWLPRFTSIKLFGLDESGKLLDWNLKGIPAFIAQHEWAHLRGECIKDYKKEN